MPRVRVIYSTFVLLAVAFGCTKERAAPAPTESAPSVRTTPPPAPIDAATPAAPDAATDAGTAACDSLSRAQCLASAHCTLELAGANLYRCRPDQGVCEVGIAQGDRKSCQDKAECVWTNAMCYCPCEGAARTITVEEKAAGCACACGGGEPAMCTERTKVEASCATLTRAACLASTTCTLHHVKTGEYACRADSGPCEVDVRQSDKRSCEAVQVAGKAACAWQPDRGYCPCAGSGRTAVDDEVTDATRCKCETGGGPPAMCVAK